MQDKTLETLDTYLGKVIVETNHEKITQITGMELNAFEKNCTVRNCSMPLSPKKFNYCIVAVPTYSEEYGASPLKKKEKKKIKQMSREKSWIMKIRETGVKRRG